jgi:hypothetical protein
MRRALLGLIFLLPATLLAGQPVATTEIETPAPWSATLATGWDSLYMFRGVNQVPGFDGYGSSLSWTSLDVSIPLTAADTLTLGTWAAFGLGDTDYKEIDTTATLTHEIGNLSLTCGYALYTVLNVPNGLYANELSVGAAYEWKLGGITLTPALAYTFELGPNLGHRGYVEQCSSYLEARIDAEIPLWRDLVSLAPWTALGTNFRYNVTESGEPFVGADHVEGGLSLPITLREGITLTPYVATSCQWRDLTGTRPVTWWGGGSVSIAF